MKIIKNILLILWQLPQNIAGAMVWLVCRIKGAKSQIMRGRVHTYWALYSGLSLGCFMFTNERASQNTINHEYGHTIQSQILGPLFLFVIGIPSIIWAGCFNWYRSKYGISYYAFYPERWADKLGGVIRESTIYNGSRIR